MGELYEVAEDPVLVAAQVPDLRGDEDEVAKKIAHAAKVAQDRDIEETARGVEGLDVNASSNGKGKEREHVSSRPTPNTDGTLPNPEVAVPIGQTAPSSSPKPNPNPPPRTDIGGLSGPSNVAELLPPAPPIFVFRPLLTEAGHEAAISLDLLGGRYYPGIIHHCLLANVRSAILDAALNHPDDSPPQECEAVLALEGISPGYHCAMSPTTMIKRRKVAITDAEMHAVEALRRDWAGKADGGMSGGAQREGTWPPTVGDDAVRDGIASMFGDENAMDVDDLAGFL